MSLTQSPEWSALAAHAKEVEPLHMRDLFAADAGRFERFSRELALSDGHRLLLDFSKNRLTDRTLERLSALARAAGVERRREA
ncbi:MAG: hypothetical protein K2Q09_00250, partial [Phycisphaerales bacterium]|nr:hypothetical protein [Phycisphaerales bacterium]